MNSQTYFEFLLFVACALVWLGPAILAMWKRRTSFLHPSFMVPAYVMFSISVALSEHWFHWSGRGTLPGIRTETKLLQGEVTLYLVPLAILLILGVIFHLGVRLGCGRAQPALIDRLHLSLPHRLPSPGARSSFALICAIGMIVCGLPYLIFGQGSGFFWTFAAFSCIPFFPFLATLYAGRYGAVLFVIGLGEMLLFPSKQNFFYYCAPYLIFWGGTLLRGRWQTKVRRLFIASCCAVSLYYGTYVIINIRNERNPDQSFLEYVLVREYGFETFAVLTNKVSLSGSSTGGRALMDEFLQLVPAAIAPFEKRRDDHVMAEVMPRDIAALPDAGYNRFFCFDAYYDFGIIGAMTYCFVFAFLLARFYQILLLMAWRLQTPWPLVCYMPWVMYAQFWANGNIPFAILFACFATAIVFLIGKTKLAHCSSRCGAGKPWLNRQPDLAPRVSGSQNAYSRYVSLRAD